MTKEPLRFVLCLTAEGFPASLELRKIYRVIHDSKAEARGLLRVVDETGEDYLYPASSFVPIEVPESAESALLGADSEP